jgi:hypothetical protein
MFVHNKCILLCNASLRTILLPPTYVQIVRSISNLKIRPFVTLSLARRTKLIGFSVTIYDLCYY